MVIPYLVESSFSTAPINVTEKCPRRKKNATLTYNNSWICMYTIVRNEVRNQQKKEINQNYKKFYGSEYKNWGSIM